MKHAFRTARCLALRVHLLPKRWPTAVIVAAFPADDVNPQIVKI